MLIFEGAVRRRLAQLNNGSVDMGWEKKAASKHNTHKSCIRLVYVPPPPILSSLVQGISGDILPFLTTLINSLTLGLIPTTFKTLFKETHP